MRTRSWLFVGASVLALSSCSEPADERGPGDPSTPGPEPHFSVVPVPPETLARITALGFNNDVLPAAHTYWETCETWSVMRLDRPCLRERQPLASPSGGVVRDVNPAADGFLTVETTPGLSWRFGHVTPAAGLAVGDGVRAGQVVATMFYEEGFDFGVTNRAVTHAYLVPEHFWDEALHGQHPILQFPDSMREPLLAAMNPAGPELGRLSYDVAGTVSGTWVAEGTGPIPVDEETKGVVTWFGRWSERPSTRIVAFGSRWSGMENSLVAADEAAPDWEEISVASGPQLVKLYNLDTEARQNLAWPAGSLLLELLDDGRLRLEWFATDPPASGFTAAARRYER